MQAEVFQRLAYPSFIPSTVTLHGVIAIVGTWFGARSFSKHQGKFPSTKSHKMEY
jgi:hypothetical protein